MSIGQRLGKTFFGTVFKDLHDFKSVVSTLLTCERIFQFRANPVRVDLFLN